MSDAMTELLAAKEVFVRAKVKYPSSHDWHCACLVPFDHNAALDRAIGRIDQVLDEWKRKRYSYAEGTFKKGGVNERPNYPRPNVDPIPSGRVR